MEVMMADLKISKVCVIGTGFMGSGIAQVVAMAGFDVLIHDADAEAMDKALEGIKWSLDKLKSKGRFEGEPDQVIQRIRKIDKLENAKDADLVIEAVSESIPLKQEIFEKLGGFAKPDAILASNTSSIPMEIMSAKVKAPERFIGMHFFGPVPLMELLELIMGPATSDETVEQASGFAKAVGKTPVVVRKPSPGFIANRIFNAAAGEALRLYAEGVATARDIDTAMKLGYHWASGPFETFDMTGIDVMAGIFKVMGLEAPDEIKEMLQEGHLGKKTGQGFYRYGPDGKKIED
jgi:3-hydroxybutyryl-CoA dehydrogenase